METLVYDSTTSKMNSTQIFLTAEKTPIPYYGKMDFLIKSGMTIDEAIEELKKPIDVEVYFDSSSASLFVIESNVADNAQPIFNPYQGYQMEQDEQSIGHFINLIKSKVVASGKPFITVENGYSYTSGSYTYKVIEVHPNHVVFQEIIKGDTKSNDRILRAYAGLREIEIEGIYESI